MEKRYDLYGNLDLPGRGSLGPVLSQSQPATVELWNRIDDLDDTLCRQVKIRTSSGGGFPPLSQEVQRFFGRFWPGLDRAVEDTLQQYYQGKGNSERILGEVDFGGPDAQCHRAHRV